MYIKVWNGTSNTTFKCDGPAEVSFGFIEPGKVHPMHEKTNEGMVPFDQLYECASESAVRCEEVGTEFGIHYAKFNDDHGERVCVWTDGDMFLMSDTGQTIDTYRVPRDVRSDRLPPPVVAVSIDGDKVTLRSTTGEEDYVVG